MKYYRYLISSILSFIILIEVMVNGNRIDRLGSIGITMLFVSILMFYLYLTCVNLYKFIRIRINLKNEELVRWSFNNEEWRRYINNETKVRFKCSGSGLKRFFKFYLILCFLLFLEPSIQNRIKAFIIHVIVIGLLLTIVIVLYNFIKAIFFYFININSNGEIIMTKKLVLINGEFNDTNSFIRDDSKSTIDKRQFTVYYDDSIQFDILKIESGEIDKMNYKGREFKIYKFIRIPVKDFDIIREIRKNLMISIKREKRQVRSLKSEF